MTSVKLHVNRVLLAQKIKEMRLERSLSQDQLSVISGLSLRTIQRLEKTGKCSHETLLALASVFDVDVSLFTDIVYAKSTNMESTSTPLFKRLKFASLLYLILLAFATALLAWFFSENYQIPEDRSVIFSQSYMLYLKYFSGALAITLAIISAYFGFIRERWFEGLIVMGIGLILSGAFFALLPWIYFSHDQYAASITWLQWVPVMIVIWGLLTSFNKFFSPKRQVM